MFQWMTPMKSEDLLTDWDKFRKQYQKAFIDKANSDRQKLLTTINNFKRAAPHAWMDLPKIDELTNKQIETLRNRDKKLDGKKAQRMARLMLQTKEERINEDKLEPLQWHAAMGELYDAIWFEVGGIVDSESHISIAHWIANPKSEPIIGGFDSCNFENLQRITRGNWKAIKQEFPTIGKDCWNEPNRILGPFIKSFDLDFSTKREMDDLPKDQRVGAVDARNALFEDYKTSKEPGFKSSWFKPKKLEWCLANIKRKQNAHKRLNQTERRFLMSRPTSFIIKRKAFVSTHWLYEMERVARTLDDKSGLSQNHSKYCSCIDCQENQLVSFV